MSTTKKIVISVTVLLVIIIIALGLYFGLSNGNTYGIPHGIYVPIDENGKKIDASMEYTWRINEKGASYGYVTGELIKEDDKIYYYYDRTIAIDKYEMSYDKKTKILTVYMPENYPDGNNIKAFQFKK